MYASINRLQIQTKKVTSFNHEVHKLSMCQTIMSAIALALNMPNLLKSMMRTMCWFLPFANRFIEAALRDMKPLLTTAARKQREERGGGGGEGGEKGRHVTMSLHSPGLWITGQRGIWRGGGEIQDGFGC